MDRLCDCPEKIMFDGNKGKDANSLVISFSFSGMCLSPLHIMLQVKTLMKSIKSLKLNNIVGLYHCLPNRPIETVVVRLQHRSAVSVRCPKAEVRL